jgi:hypothetical protein
MRSYEPRFGTDSVDFALLNRGKESPEVDLKSPVAARSLEEIGQVAGEVGKRGRRSLAVPTDVTDEEAVERLVGRTVDELGGLDIPVSNSGVVHMAPLIETSPGDWDRVVATNLRGGCEKPNARIVGQIPVRRVGRAEELGPPVVYLAPAALGDTFTLHQNLGTAPGGGGFPDKLVRSTNKSIKCPTAII